MKTFALIILTLLSAAAFFVICYAIGIFLIIALPIILTQKKNVSNINNTDPAHGRPDCLPGQPMEGD
jgi:hypothetical protein